MIVLDASVVIDFLLTTPRYAATIAQRIRDHGDAVCVPHLLDAEVGQVLRRFVRSAAIDASRAQGALDDLLAMPITRYSHGPLLERAFELRERATFYDALYLALAEALSAPLLTRDVALGKLPGHRARVIVLA